MYIKDLNDANLKLLERSKPLFSNENLTYFRKEKNGYVTCWSKNHPMLNEIIVNPIAYEFLKLCDGERYPEDVVTEALKIFKNVDRDTLKKDFIDILFKFSTAGLVTWREGKNPYMKNYTRTISEDLVIENADENDLLELKEFVIENMDNCKEELSLYLNPNRMEEEYKDEVLYREKLFLFSEEFFVLSKNGIIKGVLSILIPTRQKIPVSTFGLVIMPHENMGHMIDFVSNILLDIAVTDISKIKFLSIVDDMQSEKIKLELLTNNFESEAILKNELGKRDVEVLSYIF